MNKPMTNPIFPTSQSSLSSAELCRQRDWVPGIRLTSVRPSGNRLVNVVIEVTAIGRRHILARLVAWDEQTVDQGDEFQWDLHNADWSNE
jgi:hypothetical protein